jgi:hypothetical protein
MADVIKVVQGDEKPDIIVQIKDNNTGNVIDLSAATTTVVIKFRASGTETILSTISTSKVDPINGKVMFNFSSGVLDVDPGLYEGEIEINFNGDIQTVYDPLKFRVRQEF